MRIPVAERAAVEQLPLNNTVEPERLLLVDEAISKHTSTAKTAHDDAHKIVGHLRQPMMGSMEFDGVEHGICWDQVLHKGGEVRAFSSDPAFHAQPPGMEALSIA